MQENNTYPVLVIRGDQEPKEKYPAEELAELRSQVQPGNWISSVGAITSR